ncbi:MAG: hypothetical protein JWN37_831 [Candidatus Nomurabacteria bacterium]|nr:hypothetical protein [Candidatus Nomurabacteria bacterium]
MEHKIQPNSLMMAIQAIDEMRKNLKKEIDNVDEDDSILPDLQERELGYFKALLDLKRAYILESRKHNYSNMPSLEEFSQSVTPSEEYLNS